MPGWLASLIGALLPDPERSAFARRWGGRPAPASMLLGIVEFVGGVKLVYESAMSYLEAVSAQMVAEYLRQADQRSIGAAETLGLTWGGAVVWVTWLLHPTSWLLLSIPAVGLARSSAYLTVGEAFGEPLAWAALRFVEALRRLRDRAAERALFGSAVTPDEIETDEDGNLLVHTARPCAEWNDAVTIEIAERFYRMTRHDQVERAGARRHRYRLVEAPEHEVIRRLLRYRVPGSAGAEREPDPAAAAPGPAERPGPSSEEIR